MIFSTVVYPISACSEIIEHPDPSTQKPSRFHAVRIPEKQVTWINRLNRVYCHVNRLPIHTSSFVFLDLQSAATAVIISVSVIQNVVTKTTFTLIIRKFIPWPEKYPKMSNKLLLSAESHPFKVCKQKLKSDVAESPKWLPHC